MLELADYLSRYITTQLFVSVHVLLIVVHVILIGVAYSVYAERKISAYIQDRIGPNRVGFDFGIPALKFLGTEGPLKGVWGLGQPLADGIKFLLKEDFTPTRVDKALFTLAPVLIIIPALIGFVIIPWGGEWYVAPVGEYWITKVAFGVLDTVGQGDVARTLLQNVGGETVVVAGAAVNVGIVYLLAVASLGVYGVTLGGWASNSKYSFIGGLRATAQMISYEIPMGLTLLAALLIYGTLLPGGIIEYQAEHGWLVMAMPAGMILFFISILAEANRAPFDNAEAEQELVGGYHTEYSSMRFALFFLAEYAHMITGSAFFVLLFFGGYYVPFVPVLTDLTDPAATGLLAVLAKVLVFFGKVALVIGVQMLVRWTLPRLRYDQVMMLGWQTLIPVSLVLVVGTSFAVYFGLTPEVFAQRSGMPVALAWLPLFVMNGVLFLGVYAVQLLLPRSTVNRRLPMYGSRFFPVAGSAVVTSPTHAMAREDRPVQGTDPTPGMA